MSSSNKKYNARIKRKIRIKKKLKPESGLPRLCVFRSNKHLYAQLINDQEGKVLTSASTLSKEIASQTKGHSNIEAAKLIGGLIAQQAAQLKIESICFDRNGYRFHGKVKAVADAARAAGLKF